MVNFQVLERSTGWIVIDHEADIVAEYETKEDAVEVVEKLLGLTNNNESENN